MGGGGGSHTALTKMAKAVIHVIERDEHNRPLRSRHE